MLAARGAAAGEGAQRQQAQCIEKGDTAPHTLMVCRAGMIELLEYASRGRVNHYLVIAHRTATSPELAGCLSRLVAADPYSAFTLLVTAVHHPLVEQNAWIEAEAGRRGEEARRLLQEAGVYLARVVVGAGSPVVAAQDELIANPEMYDAIILHTRPPRLFDRLMGDVRSRIERREKIPVLHAYRGADEPWRGERDRPVGLLVRWWGRTRLGENLKSGEPPRAPVAPGRRELWPVAVLMLLYLAGGLILALTVNQGFYLNDAVALVVYSVVVGGLLLAMRHES